MEMLHDALVRELLHTYQSPEWSTEVYECVCVHVWRRERCPGQTYQGQRLSTIVYSSVCVAEGEMPRRNIPGPRRGIPWCENVCMCVWNNPRQTYQGQGFKYRSESVCVGVQVERVPRTNEPEPEGGVPE